MSLTLAAVVILVVAVLGALARAFRVGSAVERAIAERDRAEAEAKAAANQLRMQAEADEIYRNVLGMSEAELEAEISQWAR